MRNTGKLKNPGVIKETRGNLGTRSNSRNYVNLCKIWKLWDFSGNQCYKETRGARETEGSGETERNKVGKEE